jgi:inorganic pyrophosphatase
MIPDYRGAGNRKTGSKGRLRGHREQGARDERRRAEAIINQYNRNEFCSGQAKSIFLPDPQGETNVMVNYLELPVGERAPEIFRVVIEIPKDGTQKFEYDKQLHVFKLDRNLHSPVHYPGDYGFIPSTLSDDADPLDVLVLVPDPSFPGCVQEVRPIGLLEMLDQGTLDEKVLAVGKNNPRFSNIWNYTDIFPHLLKEITHFFSIYKDLEGKRVEMKGWRDAAYARDRVVYAINKFKESKAKSHEGKKKVAV